MSIPRPFAGWFGFLLMLTLVEPALGYARKVVTSCGAVASDNQDDTAAIQRCIDEAGGGSAVYFPPGEYLIGGSLRMANNNLTLYSDSHGSALLRHTGCGANSTLITASKGTKPIFNSAIKGLWLSAADSACARIAVRVIDSSWFVLEDVIIQGFHDASENSVGLWVQGREGLQLRDARIMADRPIVLSENPNYPTIDADHFHLENINSTVTAMTNRHWHVEIDPTVNLFHLTIDGTNPFAGGCGILRWIGLGAAVSNHLRISNSRHEQAAPASCDRSIYIDMNSARLQSLLIENVFFMNRVDNAIHLENVTSVSVSNSSYAPASQMDFIEIVSGARFVELRNNTLTRFANIWAPGMVWAQKFGGKDCCPPTIDSGILVPAKQTQP